jgi:hypothetical protein
MAKKGNGGSLTKPYVRISRELYERLARLAQKHGLIPATTDSRRSLVSLGIENLMEKMANDEEQNHAE